MVYLAAQEGQLHCQGAEHVGKTGSHWERKTEPGARERVRMLVAQGANKE